MKTRIGDIDVHYTIEGSGPWITLAHSLGCDTTMWDAQAALLAPNYTVLRYDARGHGQTSAPQGPYTLEQMADDVHGLFQHLGITRTHWLGISMGGMIGQTYALKYPGVFSSMVLLDTTSRRPPNAQAMWGERIAMAQAGGMAALIDSTLARLIHQNLRGSQFIVIPDAAHISNIEQPEFFNRELLKFLAQQPA